MTAVAAQETEALRAAAAQQRAEAAAVAEAAGGAGAKPQLHLVVLGHVDAGKSTLMGRLLHDLGCARRAGRCLRV